MTKEFEIFNTHEPYPHTDKDAFMKGYRSAVESACIWLDGHIENLSETEDSKEELITLLRMALLC